MKKQFFLILALLICACGSATQVPIWKDNAQRYMDDYKMNFLAGKENAAEPHFIKARKEIAAGNDLSLLATAYLTKYALHVASLESFDTAEFAKLQRLEPNAANMAYCHFLKGNFKAADVRDLSARYAGLVKVAIGGDAVSAAREIATIDDPLSRLIACGAWVRYKPFDENILQIAINTASTNGWRRPLWAYLDKLQTYYLERDDKSKAGFIKDRLELLKK